MLTITLLGMLLGLPIVQQTAHHFMGSKMRHSLETTRLRVLTADQADQATIRTSDLILAAAGVGLLGGFCLLLLAGLTADPDGFAGAPALTGNS